MGVSWSLYTASFIGFLQVDSLTLGDACHLLLLNLQAGFFSLIFQVAIYPPCSCCRIAGTAWPGSSPQAQQIFIAKEGNGVNRKGTGTIEGHAFEKDPYSFLPEAACHTVQHPPVFSPLQPVHLHPGLDHIKRRGCDPGGYASKAASHQYCG